MRECSLAQFKSHLNFMREDKPFAVLNIEGATRRSGDDYVLRVMILSESGLIHDDRYNLSMQLLGLSGWFSAKFSERIGVTTPVDTFIEFPKDSWVAIYKVAGDSFSGERLFTSEQFDVNFAGTNFAYKGSKTSDSRFQQGKSKCKAGVGVLDALYMGATPGAFSRWIDENGLVVTVAY